MCSSGGQVAADDQALQDANLKANTNLTAAYTSSMANQSQILGNLNARMAYQAANPMGYTPQQLHLATTSINENTSRAAKQAIGAAAAFGGTHGAADVGGGGTGAVVGQIASQAAQEKSSETAQLGSQDEALKQENMWKSLSGLQQVGADYGGAAGQDISGSLGASSAGVSAGGGVLQAKEQGWNELSGVLGGIAGLGKAAAGFMPK
jgi:hypothetical protein